MLPGSSLAQPSSNFQALLSLGAQLPPIFNVGVRELYLEHLVDERRLENLLLQVRLRSNGAGVLCLDGVEQLLRFQRPRLAKHVHHSAAGTRERLLLCLRYNKLAAIGSYGKCSLQTVTA